MALSGKIISPRLLEITGLLAIGFHMTSGLERSSEGLSAILCLPSKILECRVQRSVSTDIAIDTKTLRLVE